MGYDECMGYGPCFPAYQVGNTKWLWGIMEYGFSELWFIRESTVLPGIQVTSSPSSTPTRNHRTVPYNNCVTLTGFYSSIHHAQLFFFGGVSSSVYSLRDVIRDVIDQNSRSGRPLVGR
jgi:hypothetical protein